MVMACCYVPAVHRVVDMHSQPSVGTVQAAEMTTTLGACLPHVLLFIPTEYVIPGLALDMGGVHD